MLVNMGRTKGPYKEEFPVGSKIKIANRDTLEKFIEDWKFHNPLNPKQLEFADQIAEIEEIGFYHGGDELYKLVGIAGLWHEINLVSINNGNT